MLCCREGLFRVGLDCKATGLGIHDCRVAFGAGTTVFFVYRLLVFGGNIQSLLVDFR